MRHPLALAVLFLLAATVTALATPARAAGEFYVATDGSATGDGSRDRPWDLATALAHPPAVRPGDTIWLRGGTYAVEDPTTKLRGTASAPIRVRQFPGERARIDPSAPLTALGRFFDDGAWTSYEGFGHVADFAPDQFGVPAERIVQDTAPRRTRQGTPRGEENVPAVRCRVEDPRVTLDLEEPARRPVLRERHRAGGPPQEHRGDPAGPAAAVRPPSDQRRPRGRGERLPDEGPVPRRLLGGRARLLPRLSGGRLPRRALRRQGEP